MLQNQTRYKLLNRYQTKYLVDAQQNIVSSSVVDIHADALIGHTKDPCRIYDTWGLFDWLGRWWNNYPSSGAFPGLPGTNNHQRLVENRLTKFLNEGRPSREALNAFRNLTGGQEQGEIWSSIAFFSDTVSSLTGRNLTREPRPQYGSAARINTQVYPTYWFYINGKKEDNEQNQADTPLPLFPNPDRAQ